jgi:hypothetical protein
VIEQADARLRAWLAEAAGGAEIWLDPPRAGEQRSGIGLYLLELDESPPLRGEAPAPLQVQLRYLVTAWAASVEAEHKLLGDLVFAALARADLQVALRPIDAGVWRGFGIPPRAAFLLQVPLRVERKADRGPRVRELKTQFVSSGRLQGVVLGPGDVPIAGARVEAPSLGISATTASNGRFSFARVPMEASAIRLRVSAKGEVQEIDAAPPAGGKQFTIRMKLGEA